MNGTKEFATRETQMLDIPASLMSSAIGLVEFSLKTNINIALMLGRASKKIYEIL